MLAIAAAVAFPWWPTSSPPPVSVEKDDWLPQTCRRLFFEGVGYVVCEVDPAVHPIRLFHGGPDGKPYGSLDAFRTAIGAQGQTIAFAMNAGMYHEDLSPVGLHVELGREVSPVETRDGEGNFFLKPNGIFMIDAAGKARVLETDAYVAAAPSPAYATQSGPMLVIGGRLHPRFEENGASRHVRNGVGVRADGVAVFAISMSQVSFGSFARLFRDELACPDALYLDGTVSALSNADRTIIGGKYPTGPILAVLPSGD